MKRKYLLFAGAYMACMTVMAQTPYMNENYMPTDLIGSARYVGMGGALGALGADISAGSANPAALGLYRRSDAALSFSVLTQGEKPDLNAGKLPKTSQLQQCFYCRQHATGRTVTNTADGRHLEQHAIFHAVGRPDV